MGVERAAMEGTGARRRTLWSSRLGATNRARRTKVGMTARDSQSASLNLTLQGTLPGPVDLALLILVRLESIHPYRGYMFRGGGAGAGSRGSTAYTRLFDGA